MVSKQQALVVWILDDGKPGHRNQSCGLAEAIDRQHNAEIETICLAERGGLIFRIRQVRKQAQGLARPDLIIAAGHRTHIPLLYLANKTGAFSVVMMRPSMPIGWFDRCLIPEHDFAEGQGMPTNVILTKGALNRVTFEPEAKDGSGLFLIGGESKEFGFDGETLTSAIGEIVKYDPGRKWSATDSRRTPDEFLNRLKGFEVSVFPHQDTDADWLPGQLESASVVWVTEDSVSMIYEALSSGAKVGFLPMARIKKAGRVAKGVEALVEEGLLCDYETWLTKYDLPTTELVLAEADRCAAVLLLDLT